MEGDSESSDGLCLLDEAGPDDLVLDLSQSTTWHQSRQASRTVEPGQKGLYVLLYCGCPGAGGSVKDAGGVGGWEGGGESEVGVGFAKGKGGEGGGRGEHQVSFKLKVAFWNQGPGGARGYLSAGSEALPRLFLFMFALFFGSLVLWARCLRKHPAQVRVC